MKRQRSRQLALGVAIAVLAVASAAAFLVGRSGDDEAVSAGTTTTSATVDIPTVLTAEAGAAARAERARLVPAARGALADQTIAVGEPYPIECGTGGEPYVPTPEEIAAANADTDALTAVLTTYGIEYERITDDLGFAYATWDYADVVAQSVVDSFWEDRYPVVPPSQADLDRQKSDNDVIAQAFDAAGVAYTRTADDFGWDMIEWNYDDPIAQDAVNAAYAELYPPVPPTPEELASVQAENDRLAAAFDAAGIAYTRVSDEAGWEWIEWDFEVNEKVNAVFAELYPVDPLIDPIDCIVVDDAAVSGLGSGEATVEPGPAVEPGTDIGIIEPSEAFTPEQVAQRDAEVVAMATGFDAAGVNHRTVGESPWQSVIFDLDNDASVSVITNIIAGRG